MKILNLFSRKSKVENETNSQIEKENIQTTCESKSKPEGMDNKTQNQPESTHVGNKTVHNLIVLDESGSMGVIYHPALSGVNETLQTIRGAKKDYENQEHFVSLISFNSMHYNEIYDHVPADKAVDITEDQYRPNGGTPLYDALGQAITQLRGKVAKDDTVLVTIITDGMENCSREYNGPAIKALIEAMKAEGWVFTYIGANQDVEKVAASMSINNHLAFDSNESSTRAMFSRELRSRRKFFGKLEENLSREELSKDYFDD